MTADMEKPTLDGRIKTRKYKDWQKKYGKKLESNIFGGIYMFLNIKTIASSNIRQEPREYEHYIINTDRIDTIRVDKYIDVYYVYYGGHQRPICVEGSEMEKIFKVIGVSL